MHPTNSSRAAAGALSRWCPILQPGRELSVGDFDRIELAPVAQGSFGGFRFVIVPAIEGICSDQQGSKLLVGATLAEHVPDLVEATRQAFARKIQRQRLAETELSLVGDCDVFLVIVNVIGQLFLELVQIGKVGTPIDLARPPAQNGLMRVAAAAFNEFE
jgi:hypothetical protein